jgi:hypothetical protein
MDPDPDPTPDPTSFFSYVKDAKKIPFFKTYYVQSKKFNFFLQFCDKIFYFATIISVRSTPLREKRRMRSRTDPDPYL